MPYSRVDEIEFEILALYYLNQNYVGGIDRIKKIFYDFKSNQVRDFCV